MIEIEEQTKDYTRNCCVNMSFNIHNVRKAYFDGAKWGMEHEWHDLRKNPADLPKETKDYIIYHEDNTGFYHYSIRRFSHNYFECTNTVIAWCELPTYKE